MSENSVWQVLIVDDHPLMRCGIRQLLEQDRAFSVVGEAGNGSEAISLARQLVPDLIILDLNMKGLSGLDTLITLRRNGIQARVAVFTVAATRNHVFTLLDAGADGYLLKDSDPETLLQDLHRCMAGEKAFSKQVAEALNTPPNEQQSRHLFAILTERELDVLSEVARGLSNKQIANGLHISEETVKVHIRNLLRKLRVRSRLAATVLFLESQR